MHVYPRAGDFYNIHFVITALFTVPSFVERRVEEGFGSQIVGIQLPAGQSESCLFKSHAFPSSRGYGVSPLSSVLSISRPDFEPHKLYTSRALGDFPKKESVMKSLFSVNSKV